MSLYAVAVVATRPDNKPTQRCMGDADLSVARGREVGLEVYTIGADDHQTAVTAAEALFRGSHPVPFGWGPMQSAWAQPADSHVLDTARRIQLAREEP